MSVGDGPATCGTVLLPSFWAEGQRKRHALSERDQEKDSSAKHKAAVDNVVGEPGGDGEDAPRHPGQPASYERLSQVCPHAWGMTLRASLRFPACTLEF